MPVATLFGPLYVHEVPELVMLFDDLRQVEHVHKDEPDDVHAFLPCIEWNGKQYTPAAFFPAFSVSGAFETAQELAR